MGLFDKIKKNFNHGGIKVDFQAPASVSMNDSNVPISVSVTNSGEQQQTIKKVYAEIIATSRNQSFQSPNNTTNNQVVSKTVARTDNTELFVIAPGETKAIQLSIVMNAGQNLANQLPEGSAAAGVAGAFQKLESVAEAMNSNSYEYSLRASADVDGIAMDPAKDYPLQILKPGEFGAAANIRL